MTIQAKSFFVHKGYGLDQVSSFLRKEIGLDSYLIRGIQAVSVNETVTELTVIYQKYPDEIIDSFAPREGALFTTDILSDDFDARILFSNPIDFSSIKSGTFLVDGQGLGTDKVYLDTDSNNYFVKLSLSGAAFQTSAFHSYRIKTEDIRRLDGSQYSYSPVAGYIIHDLSTAHLGDRSVAYEARRRGKVSIDQVKISKGISPQQYITEYLTQKGLDNNRLIAYTSASRATNLVDVYFIYVSKLEPQIVSGFPLNQSLLPSVSAPNKVTLVFNTKLDPDKLTSTDGLFSIESGFNTSTAISASDVTLLNDQKTVEINVSSYFTSQKVYSIVARPGILSIDGVIKEKPEQWVIHVSSYQPGVNNFTGTLSGFTGVISTGGMFTGGDGGLQVGINAGFGLQVPGPGQPLRVNPGSGLTGNNLPGGQLHVSVDTSTVTIDGISNLISVGAIPTNKVTNFTGTVNTLIGYLSGDYISHIDNSSIHYQQGDISIPSTQISDFNTAVGSVINSTPLLSGITITGQTVHGNVTLVGVGNSTVSVVGGTITLSGSSQTTDIVGLSGDFISHTGNLSIHTNIAGLSGDFTSHSGDSTIHYTQASINIPYTQISSFTEGVQDVVGPFVIGVSGLSGVYNDAANTLSVGMSGVLYRDITGHFADTTIHYTQASISIPTTQISNFTEGVQDVVGPFIIGVSGLSGIYDDASNSLSVGMSGNLYRSTTGHFADTSIHYTQASISLPVSQISSTDSTKGDIIYFNGTSWAVLPLGAPGQYLTVHPTDNIPYWSTP